MILQSSGVTDSANILQGSSDQLSMYGMKGIHDLGPKAPICRNLSTVCIGPPYISDEITLSGSPKRKGEEIQNRGK